MASAHQVDIELAWRLNLENFETTTTDQFGKRLWIEVVEMFVVEGAALHTERGDIKSLSVGATQHQQTAGLE